MREYKFISIKGDENNDEEISDLCTGYSSNGWRLKTHSSMVEETTLGSVTKFVHFFTFERDT